MSSDVTPRFATPAAGRADARDGLVVSAPSASDGVAEALRSTYRIAGLPADLARLLTRLN